MTGYPRNQIIVTITVNDENDTTTKTVVNVEDVRIAPGYKEEESNQPENTMGSETIVFFMGANFDQVTFPQYYFNGKLFDP